ncbi:glycosyltransferase [Desulfovibrio sp. OttesenSCG-928-C14]|nr:glycosyltransferase [Desulfovibrio sp. OttesenSCG-928-C14]
MSADLKPPAGFSILMPVYNPKPAHIREAVKSVLAQSWPHWELCLADDASADPQVKPLLLELAGLDQRVRVEFRPLNGHIARATNTALDMANYEYCALMDQDDLLTPDALERVAGLLMEKPGLQLVFSDEDKILDDFTLFYPHFKNQAWDWELLQGQNFVNHLGVYRTDRLRALGGFRAGFEGAQDYDMLLRYTEDLDAAQIAHIPRVLYHWRVHKESTALDIGAKSCVLNGALKALENHLERTGKQARAELVPDTQFTRICFDLPQPQPLVSLIVDVGEACQAAPNLVRALFEKTAYSKLEIILLYGQGADERAVDSMLRRLEAEYRNQVRPLPLPPGAGFAEMAVKALDKAMGKIVGFIGKGLAPLSAGWLEEMVGRLSQPGVGAVGCKILSGNNQILHLGYMADAENRLFPLFRNLSDLSSGYFCWPKLARTVNAVSEGCLFTRKEYLKESGGFKPEQKPDASGIDYCLKLTGRGLRTVVTPFTVFIATSGYKAPPDQTDFSAPACHPYLTRAFDGDWGLFWKADAPSGGKL